MWVAMYMYMCVSVVLSGAGVDNPCIKVDHIERTFLNLLMCMYVHVCEVRLHTYTYMYRIAGYFRG